MHRSRNDAIADRTPIIQRKKYIKDFIAEFLRKPR